MNTHRQLGQAQTSGAKSMEKLSSGFRINRAGDDAAGLSISEKMRGQIRGLNQASRNAQDGISMIQTAEGALNETHSILQRMRELAVQSATDTNTDEDRAEIQKEADQLSQEITRIGNNTEFNTQNLLNGELTDNKFHIGANTDQNLELSVDDMRADALGVARLSAGLTEVGDNDEFEVVNTSGEVINIVIAEDGTDTAFDSDLDGDTLTITLATDSDGDSITTNAQVLEAINAEAGLSANLAEGVDGGATAGEQDSVEVGVAVFDTSEGIDISTQRAADNAITTINNAIESVSAERSKLGAVQNRLEHTISNLDNSAENLQAAESRIRDVDMAQEMMELTKQNILQQASTAMLAQANNAPQSVLQLLQ